MEALAGESGLLPEQVWDSADIPDRGLFIGHASGSAMPLVWAHAEYLKLCRSLRTGRSSIGRLRRSSGTSWRRRRRAVSSGASTTRCARCRRAGPSASRRWPRPSCIGASTAGAPCTTPRHATRRSASMWRTLRRWAAHRRPRRFHVLLAGGGAMGRDRLCRLRRMSHADTISTLALIYGLT